MPRFFFHIHDDDVTFDDEGVELPNPKAAIALATEAARGLAAEQVRAGRLNLSHRIEITDEEAAPIATIRCGDVVAVEPRS